MPTNLLAVAAPPSIQTDGYTVREYRWDGVLRQRWAVLEDALHPERPFRAELRAGDAPAGLPVPAPQPVLRAVTPVVHAGDQVILWSEEKSVRLELAAIAEENAAVGAHVRLKVVGAGINGSLGWETAGIVRGVGSVEMER